MKRLNRVLVIASIAAICGLTAGSAVAQDQGGGRGGRGPGGGGNFDPAQIEQWRQQRLDSLKERLAITDDKEWEAIKPMVTNVLALQRDQIGGSMRGMMGSRGGRGGPGGDTGGNSNRSSMFGGTPNPEEEALAKAIEAKASKTELKAKMEAYRKAKAAKEAKLKEAQDALKAVLNVQQEATALQMGLVQ